MTMEQFNRVALPGFLLVMLVSMVALPAGRVWRRTKVWAIVVHRPAHPLQRWAGGWLVAYLVALAAWVALYGWHGPGWLGVWPVPAALVVVGWALAGLGVLLTLLGQLRLGNSWRIGIDDRATELTTGGIYGVIRNPIFTGMLAMFAGVALITASAWTVVGWLLALALVGVQTRCEEEHLGKLHGDRYRAYVARVGRFLPLVGRMKDERTARAA